MPAIPMLYLPSFWTVKVVASVAVGLVCRWHAVGDAQLQGKYFSVFNWPGLCDLTEMATAAFQSS